MDKTELLREVLIDLERANTRERELRQESEGLLEGLRILTLGGGGREKFSQLLAKLQTTFGFEDAFVLERQGDGTLAPFVWTSQLFAETVWRVHSFFERVLHGQPAALFDVTQKKEWREQPDAILQQVSSALHFSLQAPDRQALMICTHSERGFFGQKHINAARRFVPLASQALLNIVIQTSLEERTAELARVNEELRTEVRKRKHAQEALNKRIIALTRPASDITDIKLADLFNLEEIQKIQDAFAAATGVASIITDMQGRPLTGPSNFSNLCENIIRQTPRGNLNCQRSDAAIGAKCIDGPWIQPCLSGGLFDAGASIRVGEQPIAIWLVGQVYDESFEEDKMVEYADEIGVDRELFRENLRKVKRMSQEQFRNIVTALNLFAQQLSTLALQNIQQAREIAERQQKDTALKETNNKLNALIQAIPDVIFFKDAQGRNLLVNRAFEQMMGITQEEIAGKLDSDIMPADLAAQCRESDESVMSQSLPITMQEKMENPDGSFKYMETIKAPIFDDEGHIIGLAGVSREVTERMVAEEEKSRLEEQLRQSQKLEAVGRLAGGVAHDFNNLLTGINGYAEMLLCTLDPDTELYSEIEQIQKAGQRAASLTNQLLAFSRKQIIHPKIIQIDGVIAQAQKLLARVIGEDIMLNFQAEENTWRINADPSQIEQVLVSMAVNARDAMPQGGRLTITTKNIDLAPGRLSIDDTILAGRFVLVTVSDNGKGMDPDTLHHVFEPFFSTKDPFKGSGLGLATVYGIVKQNQGYITVDSVVGGGTTFKMYFPAVMSPAEPLLEEKSMPVSTGSETILLVEDEQMVRKLARKILETYNYHVLEADSGPHALELAAEHPKIIDLVLTDVVMPSMNGKELYDQLLAHRPDIKVLFMSGYPQNFIADRGVLEKGTNFIQKPFTIESLTEKVRQVLG